MKFFLGIDPGYEGALACLADDGGGRVAAQLHDAPTLRVNTRREFNVPVMAAMLRRYSHPKTRGLDVHAALELVGGMPGQSSWATGRFLHGAGLWEGLLVAYAIPYTRIRPQRWMAAMFEGGIDGDGKDRSRYRALQLWPELADQLARRKDDGRADALLLAEYLRRGAPQIRSARTAGATA